MQPATTDPRLEALRTKRASYGSQTALEEAANRLHGEGHSWADVAETLGYANGAVARRAALRYRNRQTAVA